MIKEIAKRLDFLTITLITAFEHIGQLKCFGIECQKQLLNREQDTDHLKDSGNTKKSQINEQEMALFPTF